MHGIMLHGKRERSRGCPCRKGNEVLDLYVRKQTHHGATLWWLCRKVEVAGKKRPAYEPYTDVSGPTGYGYGSKSRAERRAREIEAASEKDQERLRTWKEGK